VRKFYEKGGRREGTRGFSIGGSVWEEGVGSPFGRLEGARSRY